MLKVHLVRSQDLEGGHDLLGSVCLSCLPGHEVNKSLEGDHSCVVGIHQCHNACKFYFTLKERWKLQKWRKLILWGSPGGLL